MCFTSLYDARIYNYALSFVWTISNVFYLSLALLFDLRTKVYEFNSFVPNKVSKYSRKAVILSIFRKRKKA